MLGQKIGRRTILALMGLAGSTVGPFLYYVPREVRLPKLLQVILLVTLVNLCAIPAWAIVTCYIIERFPHRCQGIRLWRRL